MRHPPRPRRNGPAINAALAFCLLSAPAQAAPDAPPFALRSTEALTCLGEPVVAVVAGGATDAQGGLRGARVQIWAGGPGPAWDGFDPALNPWMVRAGRFAGRNLLLVGVRKPATFDPAERKRPFLYEIKPRGAGLNKIWLGTCLSRPFEYADFADLDAAGEDELVALERTREGALSVGAYRWVGFGVEGLARSEPIPGAVWLQPGDVWPGGGEEVVVETRHNGLLRFVACAVCADALAPVAEVWANPGRADVRWGPVLAQGPLPGGILITSDHAARLVRFRPLFDPSATGR